MDRDQLREKLLRIDWRNLPRLELRISVTAAIGHILTEIERNNREPDNWERHQISSALGMIACGYYLAALNHAGLVLEPPEARSLVPSPERDRDLATMSLSELRRKFQYVQGLSSINP